ncbi:hypothetical protein [Corynebacterium dentalis]|uniref:hypothetical protein n=1 Tax=Corynebacterium dentalis TaxID=2014528 RepID=UPI002899FFDA|nr:hypothetical protein [Corynebacterium dentalis]
MTSSHLFETLSHEIPSANDPQQADAFRRFVSNACIFTTQSFYNVVLILVQNPQATAALSKENWEAIGRTPQSGARPLIISQIKGPTSVVYEISTTESRQSRTDAESFEKLPEHRFSLSLDQAVGKLEDLMAKYGLHRTNREPAPEELQQMLESRMDVAVTPVKNPSRHEGMSLQFPWPSTFTYVSSARSSTRLMDIIYAASLATITYRVPWLTYPEDSVDEKSLYTQIGRASEPRSGTSSTVHYFEAAMATFILGRRLGWQLEVPLATEFLASDDQLAPEGTSVVRMCQAVHFLEKEFSPLTSNFFRLLRDL